MAPRKAESVSSEIQIAELKRGVEGGVLLTHIVFGLFAAGAYRGLLKRRTAAVSSSSD